MKFAATNTPGRVVLTCLLLMGSYGAIALDPVTHPLFADAPPTMRDFLIKAETADKIVDPLSRCLAFPDFPGNHWPAGLAKADCEYSYGPSLTQSRVRALVDASAFAKLDALFAADLDRHFSEKDFSEVIHHDFDAFDASYESGRLTKRWLEKDPSSPYALDARAVYYRNMAESARGEKWMSETPPENVLRMHEFVNIAVDLYQRALKVEPRLLPAYVGLINVSRLDSREPLGEDALRAAKGIDPACRSVSSAQMVALEPRWGGSYPEMEALSKEIAPFVSRRPLLALNTIWPAADKGERLYADDKYDESVSVLEPVVLETTNSVVFEQLANSLLLAHGDRRWEALTLYVAATRYSQGQTYENKERGRLLLFRARRPAWALPSLKRAVELNPNEPVAKYLLAQAYMASDQWPQVAAQYGVSFSDPPDSHRETLAEGVTRLVRDGDETKALAQVEQLNAQYPTYAKGWLLRSWALGVFGKPGGADAMQRFMGLVDSVSSAYGSASTTQ